MIARALLAVGIAAVLPAQPASAKRCPYGQFYRPSMRTCVGRDAFLKAFPHYFAGPAAKARQEGDAAKPPHPADEAVGPPPARPASAVVGPAEAVSRSPFGAIPGVKLN